MHFTSLVSKYGLVVGCALTSAPGLAQPRDEAFAGPYIGASVGAAQHHFVLEEENEAGEIRRFNVSRWGVGGQAFIGYAWAISRRAIVALDAQADIGGRSAVEQSASYRFGFDPRYGLSVSARAGYEIAPAILLYAGAGYGEHRYRTIAVGNVAPEASRGLDKTSSFVLRAGLETRVFRKVNARLEFMHLDGSRNSILLGFPLMF